MNLMQERLDNFMQPQFEEIDYQETPLGDVILRRRTMLTLDNLEVYEIMLGEDFLMSSLFTVCLLYTSPSPRDS